MSAEELPPVCGVCGKRRWRVIEGGEFAGQWQYSSPCYESYAGRRADCPEFDEPFWTPPELRAPGGVSP